MRRALRWLADVWRAWLTLQARTWQPSRRAGELAFRPACEDLRRSLEATSAWRRVQARLDSPRPLATWQAYGLHYFRYACRAEASGPGGTALFVVRGSDRSLVSAVLVGGAGAGDPAAPLDLTRSA